MIDPITLEVARNRFSAIAEEMGGVLRRTSLS
ncbi:MAG: hydantoinase B/oxoprolinase family protein, partial [Acidimicrobiia bacterium]